MSGTIPPLPICLQGLVLNYSQDKSLLSGTYLSMGATLLAQEQRYYIIAAYKAYKYSFRSLC